MESKPDKPDARAKAAASSSFYAAKKLGDSIILVILGFGISAIIIELAGYSAPGAYGAILSNAVTTPIGLSRTFWAATSLTLTGLGATVAFRAGLFNIGVQGQAFIGAFMGFLIGYYFAFPAFVEIPMVIVASALGGIAWSIVPAFLKAYRGVNEVVTTIMMNYIAIYLVSYLQILYKSPYANSSYTSQVNPTATFRHLSTVGPVDTGIFVALLSVAAVLFVMWYTTVGYSIRLSGMNPFAARYAGVSPVRMTFLVMMMSGGLAGIGGALFTNASTVGFFDTNTLVSAGVGLNGITVSLVGQLTPIGTFLGAILVGAISASVPFVEIATGMPPQIVQLITGVIVVAAAIPGILATIQRATVRWRSSKNRAGGESKEEGA